MLLHSNIGKNATFFIFRDNTILVKNDETKSLPTKEIMNLYFEAQSVKEWFYEPSYNYQACFLESDSPAVQHYCWIPLREFFSLETTFSLTAARAYGLLLWKQKMRFCTKCGHPLQDDKFETARICTHCNELYFPQLSPAIIVLIEKDDTILLARHKNRISTIFTCIAGYVEMGETLEECVQREIKEEVGLSVKNIRYVGSQSWPFPDQIMLAFKATYASGEIVIQPDELEEARWFKKDTLPPIPKPGSIAYKLIMNEL